MPERRKHKKTFYPQWFIDELYLEEDKEKARNGLLSTTQKVEFLCTCGNTYIQKITNHINLSTGERKYGSCKECTKKKIGESFRKSQGTNKSYPQWFIDELYLNEDKEKASSGELSTNNIVSFICLECGNVYQQRITSHITLSTGEKKQGCPVCGIKKQIKSSRKTKEIIKPYPQWFIDELYLNEDKEKAKKENFYGKEELQFYCSVHDLVYKKKVRDIINLKTHEKKAGCPQCTRKEISNILYKKEYPDWFIDELYSEDDKEKARKGNLLLSEKVDFFCVKHNEVYKQLVGSHIDLSSNKKKHGCSKCGREVYLASLQENRNYPEWFIEELVNEEDKIKARNGSLVSSDLVDFKCSNGHIYNQYVKDHIILSRQERYKGCPYCSPYRSSIELEIEEYIKSLGFVTEHKRFHSSILSLFEADIFIPEKNIAIEYNGFYFHKTLPIDGNNKSKMYHNQKYYSFKELGIRLISIFDVDWENRQDKIKQYLKDLLLPVRTKLYARDTEIREVGCSIANSLYNQYHLLGKTTIQTVSYGLYYNNELLACMSFQKGRYKEGKNPIWCLTRFVTVSGYSIVGGASKLLSHFEKEYTPSILVSYSDNDYFSGNLYSKLGFTCLGDTESPRYYWWLNNEELKREQCQLNRLKKLYPEFYKESDSKGNKEDYIMLKLGACKVYRSGHTKWIKKYN